MANLDALKAKYQSAIDLGKARGVSWKNVHVENEKLLLRGSAPNDTIKNEVWDRIKKVDASYADLTADITIDDAAITARYESNQASYQTSETVDLQYIELALADVAATVDALQVGESAGLLGRTP